MKYESILLGYWYLHTRGFVQNPELGSDVASCSGSDLHQTAWGSSNSMYSHSFLCLQHELQTLLGAAVQPSAWSTYATGHAIQAYVDPTPLFSSLPCSNLLHLLSFWYVVSDVHLREADIVGRSFLFGFGYLFSNWFLWVSQMKVGFFLAVGGDSLFGIIQ